MMKDPPGYISIPVILISAILTVLPFFIHSGLALSGWETVAMLLVLPVGVMIGLTIMDICWFYRNRRKNKNEKGD